MAIALGSSTLARVSCLRESLGDKPKEAAMTLITILALTLLLVWCELAGAPLR